MPSRRDAALRLASGGRLYLDPPAGPSWSVLVLVCLVAAALALGVLWLVRGW
jgi:hypothetical protein